MNTMDVIDLLLEEYSGVDNPEYRRGLAFAITTLRNHETNR